MSSRVLRRCYLLLTAFSASACGAASAPAPNAVTVAPPSLKTTAPPTAEIEERLRRHFAQYEGASSFAFFERDFAPRVERYLGLKDVPAPELARIAAEFYRDKQHVSLLPKPGSVTSNAEGGRVTVSLVLSVRWSTEPPAAAATCGYLDASMEWRPHSLIERRVEVTARIELDAAARMVTYEEAPVALPLLRVASRGDELQGFSSLPTAPARLVEPSPTTVLLRDGTLVEDLGETFTCGLDQTEVDTVRKVRSDGGTLWLLADWIFYTGHSFVGDTPLVPAH